MIYFIIALLIVLGDQLSKYFLALAVSSKGVIEFIPGFIRIVYLENTGAAFSFLPNMRWVLVGVTSAVILAIAVVLVRYGKKLGRPSCYALAFVLGGALSNLVDRALFGHVADFFDFEFIHFAVFNVADICITVGGIVFCLFYIFHSSEGDGKKKNIAESAPDTLKKNGADAGPADGGAPEAGDGTNQG